MVARGSTEFVFNTLCGWTVGILKKGNVKWFRYFPGVKPEGKNPLELPNQIYRWRWAMLFGMCTIYPRAVINQLLSLLLVQTLYNQLWCQVRHEDRPEGKSGGKPFYQLLRPGAMVKRLRLLFPKEEQFFAALVPGHQQDGSLNIDELWSKQQCN